MTEPRPSPEQLLARIREEEARAARGRLKIFFGANPGVGKTFAMLEEARAKRVEGMDVVVGLVETHGRAETAAQLQGLEQLPRLTLEHRGVTLTEFDLDAALARRPTLLLVDELAHTNAPGLRHERRWQDVEDLLAAGISVYTTLNVQHLESLNDVVAQITGVQVRETVPDSVFDGADDVELADLTPEDLLRRMQQGKVYLAEQAERAGEGFFRKGNLIALRELALRRVAERVDAQMRGYMRDHGIREVWPAGERVLVAVSDHAAAARLVRAGRRIASTLKCDWIVLHVETPGTAGLSDAGRARLVETLQLAEEAGAETVTVPGRQVAEEILSYAAAHNVTRILAGKPTGSSWRARLLGSTVDRLLRGSGDVDVYVITGDAGENEDRRRPVVAPRVAPAREYRFALATVAVCTLVGWLVLRHLSTTDVSMIYLLGSMVVASRCGRGPSLLAAGLSIAVFDFVFVPPYYTFAVSDFSYVLTFGTMLVVALLISGYTLRIREQAQLARDREHRTAALYALSRDLGQSRGREDVVVTARKHLGESFGSTAQVLAPGAGGELELLNPIATAPVIDEKELSVADWAFRRGELAGSGTATLPGATALHLPLSGASGVVGVLALWSPDLGRFQDPSERHLLETFAGQVGVALERVTLEEKTRQARLEVEAERLRTSLLSSLSHDLRTPLGVITGAASSLRDNSSLTPEARLELLESIVEESQRMNRLIRNLLDMIRVETGSLQVQKEWQPLEDAVGVSLIRLGERLQSHPVSVQLPPDLPLVPLDAVLLEQVFINLLENAAKYTPDGSPIEISAVASPGVVTVSVADRGPGLPPGGEERVFEKFYRGEDAPPGKGVGLGLTIARGIVTAHGGRIWAETRPEGGAVFRFTLPLTGTAPPPIPVEEVA
ncbi:MAG TPA: sensor histidine kinase KdpD [Gemmatimonadales bacterium]|nr:sensor histidine kinase KdpD [Gemmatimonadales bacterium]